MFPKNPYGAGAGPLGEHLTDPPEILSGSYDQWIVFVIVIVLAVFLAVMIADEVGLKL